MLGPQTLTIRPVRTRSAPIDEWVRNIADTGSHDTTLIREVISKCFKKSQAVKCLGCGKQGHFKKDCRQGIPCWETLEVGLLQVTISN